MATTERRSRWGANEWEGLAVSLVSLGLALFSARESEWHWTTLFALSACVAALSVVRPWWRRAGRGREPAARRFRVLRALRATQLDVPHYFLEVDDRSVLGRFTMHLSGPWLFQFEPKDWRPRKFPSTEITVLPSDDHYDTMTGDNHRLEFTGEPFEPLVSTREVPPQSAGPDWLRDAFEPIPVSYDDVLRFFAGELDAHQVVSQEDLERSLGPRAWRVRARRALCVEAQGQHVPHYYVELRDLRVLHLSGRYLLGLEPDEADERTFPSDEFEPMVVPASLLELPQALNPLGAPFEPTVAGRKINAEDRDQGWVPQDWERVDRPYDEVAAHFGAVPAQASPDRGSPADRQPPARPEPAPAPITEASGAVAAPPDDGPPPLDAPVFSTSLDRDLPATEDDE